jgi:hypothetical protein
MYWNITPSWSSWNYVSNEPSFAWNGFRTRELCLFYSSDAICNFQNVQRLMFLPYLLVQVFKIDDPWCVGKMFEGASEYELLFHCTSLNTFSNLDGNNSFPLKPCRWLTILIAIGQELMGTLGHACETNQMHILPPGVIVGSRNSCQQTKYIPMIFTCGITYVVKRNKREPNECTCV